MNFGCGTPGGATVPAGAGTVIVPLVVGPMSVCPPEAWTVPRLLDEVPVCPAACADATCIQSKVTTRAAIKMALRAL
jgi:hypothetical protein